MQDDAKRLEPCPFCGSDELSHGWNYAGIQWAQVECHNDDCQAHVFAETEAEAIAAWNTRTPAPAQPADVEPMPPDVIEAMCDAFMGKIVVDGNGGLEFLEEAMSAALAAMPVGEPVSRVEELSMIAFADLLPVRDECKGEQTILTYSENVGVFSLEFFESGWDFPDRWLGASHWLDISEMWPGVTAQVTEYRATPPVDADAGLVEPTPAMINRGVDFAIKAKLSGEYTWPDYVADLYREMNKAALGQGGVR